MLILQMTAPLQVRPANQGKEEERKLFVGMIPKTFTDPELKALLSRYGVVEEATILRDKDGLSKGNKVICGVKYCDAIIVIQSVNG